MSKSLRAQPFDDSILGIGIKIGIDGGSRLVSISHSMSAPVSASTTHKKISTSSSKKWVPSQACNICLIDCLMLFSTSRMTVHQKLMDNFHFAFGIGRPKNIQHNPPGPSVDMENICSTNLMWEVKSIFLEYQVYVINLAYSGATDNRCANFSASTCPTQALQWTASSEADKLPLEKFHRLLNYSKCYFYAAYGNGQNWGRAAHENHRIQEEENLLLQ